MESGGGGGYGDPLERDPEAVRADVREGFVSAERAREGYGVVLGAAGEVDGGDSLGRGRFRIGCGRTRPTPIPGFGGGAARFASPP